MDAVELGFLQALREDPRDWTTRLVYADWLDERDDPRGAFLREEVELMTLPSGEARTRELQARLGDVVLTFDGNWVAECSLVGHELFRMRGGLAKGFMRTDRFAEWRRAVANFAELFTGRFTALADKDRFRVPLDYTLFCGISGAGWSRDGDEGVPSMLYSIGTIRGRSKYWLSRIVDRRADPSGLWLAIGSPFSTRHEYYLCCDRLHPAFGSVYQSYEDIGPYDLGLGRMDLLALSFLDFLRTITP